MPLTFDLRSFGKSVAKVRLIRETAKKIEKKFGIRRKKVLLARGRAETKEVRQS